MFRLIIAGGLIAAGIVVIALANLPGMDLASIFNFGR